MICKHGIHILICNKCYYDTPCKHRNIYYNCEVCFEEYCDEIKPRWDCNYISFIIRSYLKSKLLFK